MASPTSSRSLLSVRPFTIFIALVLTFVLTVVAYSSFHSVDPYRCLSLKNEGRWLDTAAENGGRAPFKTWQPQGCIAHQYKAVEIARCLENRTIVFAGDSTVRQVYWAAARKLDVAKARELDKQAQKRADQNFTAAGVQLQFIWDPYLNSSRLEDELWAYSEARAGRRTEQTGPALMLLGAGAWFARWFDEVHSFPQFQLAIENVTAYVKPRFRTFRDITSRHNGSFDHVFLAPVPIPAYDEFKGLRKENILPGEMEKMNDYLRSLGPDSSVLWSYLAMTEGQPDALEAGGLHVVESVADAKADILLNLRCNAFLDQIEGYSFDRTCCTSYQTIRWEQQLILVLAMLLALLVLCNVVRGIEHSALLSASFFFFATLLYCYTADRTQLFAKVSKNFVWTDFSLLCGAVLLIGMLTIRRSGKPGAKGTHKDQPFLSRDQTEEWKGWMQFAILIYHYTGASSILPVYQVIRLLVAAYLFLTGFGHTCYFFRKSDFSPRRVANVLIRINLLSCALPYIMGTDYLFYYFAPLVTFWFAIVYITMRVFASKNDNTAFVICKIAVGAVLVSIILKTSAFDLLFSFLRTVFRIEWDVHEWKFRLHLDRYIVFVGMTVAILFERYNDAVASGPLMPSFNLIRIPAIILSLIALPAIHTIFSTFTSKTESNSYHPYISAIPILAFITLRNATQTLRNYHSTFFAWLGTFSLETFVLQYHIWLAADTKGLLSLGIFHGDGSFFHDRWRDFVVLTPVFLWVSWKLAEFMGTLTQAIMHQDGREGDSLLDDGLMAEKDRGSSWFVNVMHRGTGILIPKDYKIRLGLLLLCMWVMNWLW